MITPSDSAVRALVHQIVSNADKFEWSLQGFGMLRLHMHNNWRLHIWHRDFAVPNVSVIHDHLQWGLTSQIIAGEIVDVVYDLRDGGEEYHGTVLKPGYGTYFKELPTAYELVELRRQRYGRGERYSHLPSTIHESRPQIDGTVTLMQKAPTGNEAARVFWPRDTEWVSAEPRLATKHEVRIISAAALKLLEVGE